MTPAKHVEGTDPHATKKHASTTLDALALRSSPGGDAVLRHALQMPEPKKQESLDHICHRLGLPKMYVGDPGSSIPAEMFHGAATQFGIDPSGQMPVVGERIAQAAGLEWTAACDSRHTTSRGGSTVTRTGMRVLRDAIDILSEAQEARSEDGPLTAGLPYVEAVGGVSADPAILEQDWAAHDKASVQHAATQNALAALVMERGLTALSPLPGGPKFDLAWRCTSGLVVVEVKTTMDTNRNQQCRLGLGQVLEYKHRLMSSGEPEVRAVLAVSSDPGDLYRSLGGELGVVVTTQDRCLVDLDGLLNPSDA